MLVTVSELQVFTSSADSWSFRNFTHSQDSQSELRRLFKLLFFVSGRRLY